MQAGDLGLRVSNQSLRETITLTQLVDRGGKEDVIFTLLTDPAPQSPSGSRALKPGDTARITLQDPPKEGQDPEVRQFRLTREGDPAECYFAYQAGYEKGKPVAVLQYDPCMDPRVDLVQVEPDLLVFCGSRRRDR
jgi:hypothetical protein